MPTAESTPFYYGPEYLWEESFKNSIEPYFKEKLGQQFSIKLIKDDPEVEGTIAMKDDPYTFTVKSTNKQNHRVVLFKYTKEGYFNIYLYSGKTELLLQNHKHADVKFHGFFASNMNYMEQVKDFVQEGKILTTSAFFFLSPLK